MILKGDMKSSKWIAAYENNNVDVGLACGFSGKAQIGKGMWAAPDMMKQMISEKISHLKAGANCAKFQSFKAEKIVSDEGFKLMDLKGVHGTWDQSVYDIFKKVEFPREWHKPISNYCNKIGINIWAMPMIELMHCGSYIFQGKLVDMALQGVHATLAPEDAEKILNRSKEQSSEK